MIDLSKDSTGGGLFSLALCTSPKPVLWTRIRTDPHLIERKDPDPHQIERKDQDPHQRDKLDPDPHQSERKDTDPHKFADDKPICMDMSLFGHFFKVLSLYYEASIWICIKVKGRIRIYIKVTSRI
jgi:hypothetical protein